MPNEFLDFNGLKVYDEKLKAYIKEQIDNVINISLFGNNGYSLIGQGGLNIPTWVQNAGFRVCDTDGNINVKSVVSDAWTVEVGGIFAIKFAHSHIGSEQARLSINNVEGPIYWRDLNICDAQNSWSDNEIVLVCWQGESWCIINDSPSYIKNLKLSTHPIGSIYMSAEATNPSELFGGEWEQIKDTFLLTAGDTYTAGETGGSADAVVVSHEHKQNSNIYFNGSESENNGKKSDAGMAYAVSTLNALGNDHWLRTWSTGNTLSTGEDGTGKNMPPYLVVYAWKRIS